VGRKGFDYFSKRGYTVARKYTGLFAALQFNTAREIAADAMAAFLGGEYDRIDIVYNEFKSIMQQRINIEQFLPIAPADTPDTVQEQHVDYIYEPSSEAIISALVPRNINVQVWRILLESNAAEQGARMTAMDNATTNASDLIHDLQLSYNKARQASITKELLEIVSGAEALRQAS